MSRHLVNAFRASSNPRDLRSAFNNTRKLSGRNASWSHTLLNSPRLFSCISWEDGRFHFLDQRARFRLSRSTRSSAPHYLTPVIEYRIKLGAREYFMENYGAHQFRRRKYHSFRSESIAACFPLRFGSEPKRTRMIFSAAPRLP